MHSIVGYQTLQGNQNITFITPTFGAINGNYSVQDIKISGPNVTGFAGQQIQIIDADGMVTDENTFFWFNESDGMGAEGWFTGDFAGLTDRTLDQGASLMISNPDGEFEIQFAGQVITDAIVAYPCDQNITSIGNMTPVEKTIQSFVISGEAVTGFAGQQIQIIDSEGMVTDENTFFWFNEADGMGAEGWFKGDFSGLTDRVIPAGQGILLSNPDGEYVVTIPGALDDAE